MVHSHWTRPSLIRRPRLISLLHARRVASRRGGGIYLGWGGTYLCWGIPTLDRGTYPGWGVPTLARGYLPWPGGDTYLGWGVPPPQVWTNKQAETVTFPHPTEAGGKYPIILVSRCDVNTATQSYVSHFLSVLVSLSVSFSENKP